MSAQRSYWLDLFTGNSWEEFIKAGANTSGYSEHHWKGMKQVKIGDYLLCYITGISSFVGVLEVISDPFKAMTRIWTDSDYPCRFRVKPVLTLDINTSVPIREILPALSFSVNPPHPMAWVGRFRKSLTKFSQEDAETIITAIEEAVKSPVVHEVDKRKLARRPKPVQSEIGSVTIPADIEEEEAVVPSTTNDSEHTEIQYLLLKLGSDMGLGVMVARNDKSRSYKGQLFSDIKGFRTDLPVPFDPATKGTIQLIDVLWIKDRTILAAFEVESTTSIYSGLLRMSDLISMQPNLTIPLYLVAPDSRRDKVITEVNRPTFTRMSPPMYEMCKYLSFEKLKDELSQIKYARYLRPEFIDEISETCEIDS